MEQNALTVVDKSHAPAISEALKGGLVRKTLFDLSQNDFDRLIAIAKMYAASSLNSGKKWEDYFLIMSKGMEIGFQPMASIGMISIIKGVPALDGKGMLALIYASELLEDISIDSSDTACTVSMTRKGIRKPFSFTFTVENAKAMGLTGKDGNNYQKQPKVMLKWRAIANCSREAFPDVLGGLYTIEEIASESVTVLEDGTMQISTPSVPALPAQTPAQSPSRDINDVDKMIFGEEDASEEKPLISVWLENLSNWIYSFPNPVNGQRNWIVNLAKVVYPMYKHENHLQNGIIAALDSGEISFSQSVDKAALNLFIHRCGAEWGLSDSDLPALLEKALGMSLKTHLENNPRDYGTVWAALKGLMDELNEVPEEAQETGDLEGFPE